MKIHWVQTRRVTWNTGTKFEKTIISYEGKLEGVTVTKETLISEGKPDTGYYIQGDEREYGSERELKAMVSTIKAVKLSDNI